MHTILMSNGVHASNTETCKSTEEESDALPMGKTHMAMIQFAVSQTLSSTLLAMKYTHGQFASTHSKER